LNRDAFIINSVKLRQAIRSTPVVYPPNLEFLGNSPVEESYVVRQLLASPVYAPASIPFFAFFSAKDGRSFLTLLVTSDSLRSPVGQDAQALLVELYQPPRRVGWWERLTAQIAADKRQRERIREQEKRGEIDSRLANALRKLYFPVFHDDDVIIDFPEDDFMYDRERSFDSVIRSSGIKRVCPRIQPVRCGLPAGFTNNVFARFRSLAGT